jgi:DNA-directed RNA polymerase subunit RPC12/RpoP
MHRVSLHPPACHRVDRRTTRQATEPAVAEEPAVVASRGPSQRQQPVAIRTIGDLGERNQLYAHCQRCRHRRQLDLAALRERHGPDLSLTRLRARLRCSRCGARSVETRHVWDAGLHARP